MLHEDAGPEALALFRIAVFGVWSVVVLASPPLALAANVPRELFSPPGVLGLLPDAAWEALFSPAPLWALTGVILVLTLAAAAGLGPFGLIGPLAFGGILLFDGIQKGFGGYINHAQFGLLYAALLVAVSPAADALEFRLGTQSAPPTRPAAAYRFPLVGTGLLLALAYSLIGLYRAVMGGAEMFTGDALPTYMALRTVEYGPWQYEWTVTLLSVPAVVGALKAGFAVTTILEIFSPLALVWRYFRLLWLGVIVPFHLVTLVTMNIFFWENLILLGLVFTGLLERASGWMGTWRDRPSGGGSGRAMSTLR